MTLTLPVRIVSTMRRASSVCARSGGRSAGRQAPDRASTGERSDAARVRPGQRAWSPGGSSTATVRGSPGPRSRVLELADQPRAARRGAADRRRRPLSIHGAGARAARFGSPTPARRSSCRPGEITMRVPGRTSLRVNRRRVLNGQTVRSRGGCARACPARWQARGAAGPPVRRWQTFRTTRTDAAGRWAIRYRFKRTRGVQRFRFRARLPHEANYPFAAGWLPLADRPRARGAMTRRLRRRPGRRRETSPRRSEASHRRRTRAQQLRQRLTYANVMSTLAVFIALGGSSYAASDQRRQHREPLDPGQEAQAQRDHRERSASRA